MTQYGTFYAAPRKKNRRAFTMIEIMIVILVMGIVVAIVVPSWLKARGTAQAKICQETQAQLEGAIDRWSFENNKTVGDEGPSYEDIVGPESMIKKTPMCPSGGIEYEIPRIGLPVVCPNIDQFPAHFR